MRLFIIWIRNLSQIEGLCNGTKLIVVHTVSPNKLWNSVTIFNVSTSAQLGCKINVWRGGV